MKRVMSLMAALLTLGALEAAADVAEVERQRERWQMAQSDDYVYGYQKYCECHRETPPETVVTVSDGRIVRVHHEHAGSDREVPAREGSLDLYWTVDDLFDLAADAYEAGAEVRVSYDDERGLPRELYIDYDSELVGDEIDLRITRFRDGTS